MSIRAKSPSSAADNDTLRFSDESTPTRRRKPRGVLGAEVWVALAAAHDPPPLLRFAGAVGLTAGAVGTWEGGNVGTDGGASSPSHLPTFAHSHAGLPGFRFLSVSTSGTLQADFSTAEAGKTAYYALRWLSTRGAERGSQALTPKGSRNVATGGAQVAARRPERNPWKPG